MWTLSTMFTKGLPLGKQPVCCGHFSPDNTCFFPVWQWEDFLNYNRDMDSLDDIKVFESSEEVDDCANDSLMLQMMQKNEAPYRLSGLIWTLQDRKITENLTPCTVYIKVRGRVTPEKPKQVLNRQRKKLNIKCQRQKEEEKRPRK